MPRINIFFHHVLVLVLMLSTLLFTGCVTFPEISLQKPEKPMPIKSKTQVTQGMDFGKKSIPGNTSPPVSSTLRKEKSVPVSALKPFVFIEEIHKPLKVSDIIDRANDLSIRNPVPELYNNAAVTYRFEDNAMYTVITAPMKITNIRFKNDESIVSVTAGDTVNYLIEHIVAGNTPHLLIKPLHFGLKTNLTVLTDKRVYLFIVKSWKETFMAACKFTYPRVPDPSAEKKLVKSQTGIESGLKKQLLDDEYTIESKCKDCLRPKSVHLNHTTGKLHIIMPKEVMHGALPALFALNSGGKEKVINYRFVGRREFVIDGIYPWLVLKYSGKNRDVYIYKSHVRRPKKPFRLF